MKRNLLTLAAIGTLALAGYALAEPHGGFGGGHGDWHGQGLAMGHLTKALNLTAEQQSKVQPLIDQARPRQRDCNPHCSPASQPVDAFGGLGA